MFLVSSGFRNMFLGTKSAFESACTVIGASFGRCETIWAIIIGVVG